VLVDTVFDMQPANSYPAGKTAKFNLTSTGANRPQLVSGELASPTASPLFVASSAAELLALANGSDTPWTFLFVGTAGSEINGHSGSKFANANDSHQFRVTQHQTDSKATIVRYDGTNLVQVAGGTADTNRHVFCGVFDGTNFTVWDESGQVATGNASAVNALTFTAFSWLVYSAAAVECAMWNRSLTATERLREITRAAVRWRVPLA